ncbi:MAG: phosphate ABC transporter permease subunit PstC [Chloroflexi bacterium]|nr:phosphate ABC transporter permease subunit PstC [Chloroflexota bacterium]
MEVITKETIRSDKIIKVNPFKLNPWRRLKDLLSGGLMSIVITAILALILIMGMLLLVRSWPIMSTYPLRELLTSTTWRPTRGEFGFAPFIVGSLTVTLIAGFIAVIPALLSGIYLAEYTSRRSRSRLKPLLDLLVGIPSVVYGLWGILFIVPLIRDHAGPWSDRVLGGTFPFFARTNPSGYGLLAGGFVLGVMIFPIIVAVTDEVLRNVPREMRESLQALGATRWEATKVVVFKASLPGVLAAVVLGFSRAFGETLAVMMVVGNNPNIPASLFDTAYPLPALIANNYSEMMSIPMYDSALMGAALLLLVVILFFNVVARLTIMRVSR